MTNQYMNTLYQDLFSNSPQSVVMELPPEMGSGTISQVVTKQNVVFSSWEMTYFEAMNAEGSNSADFIQIMFCLDEGISWQVEGSPEHLELHKGESCIYRGHGKIETVCYGGNRHFLFKSVKIPIAYFNHLMESYFEEREIETYQDKLFHGVSKINITPYMEHVLAELQEFEKFRGGLGYLFLESKISELLSVYLSALLEIEILTSDSISKSDRNMIEDARKIIDSELAFAPSCEELAQKVNVSVSKLTKGFSSLYGISVHAYIIEQRLKRASVMLLESNLNVTQISALIGYSKPSNFSAAFKRKFGVSPKDYKRENSIGSPKY